MLSAVEMSLHCSSVTTVESESTTVIMERTLVLLALMVSSHHSRTASGFTCVFLYSIVPS